MKKNKPKAKIDRFSQGYACAVAMMVAGHGIDVMAEEALRANGFTTIESLEESGIEHYDIEILRPVIERMQRNEAFIRNRKLK